MWKVTLGSSYSFPLKNGGSWEKREREIRLAGHPVSRRARVGISSSRTGIRKSGQRKFFGRMSTLQGLKGKSIPGSLMFRNFNFDCSVGFVGNSDDISLRSWLVCGILR